MRQEVVSLVDDIDGTAAERTILVVDPSGIGYEIDLNTEHLDDYEDAIADLVANGRRRGKVHVSAGGGPARSVDREQALATRKQNQAIREWAQEQGIEIGAKGRIAVDVREAYHAQVG